LHLLNVATRASVGLEPINDGYVDYAIIITRLLVDDFIKAIITTTTTTTTTIIIIIIIIRCRVKI